MEQQNKLQKNLGIFFGVAIIIGVFVVTIFWGQQSANTTVATTQTPIPTISDTTNSNGTNSTPKPAPTPITTQTPPVDTPKKSSSVYKDGTYTATGSYMSPGGYEQLGVSITLQNDIITSASVTNMAGDGRSQRYQNMFISSYQQYVVGKNIANVYLTKVSGSSLTPSGFNDALNQIKSQALA